MVKTTSQIDTTAQTDKRNPLIDTLDLIETNLDVKSYIYQQINDLNPYVTEETTIMVMARDPYEAYKDENHLLSAEADSEEKFPYRIAIVLKEDDGTLEAEGFGFDIYDAIRYAKEAMLHRLSELQEEVESPQDRMRAIQQAVDNSKVH